MVVVVVNGLKLLPFGLIVDRWLAYIIVRFATARQKHRASTLFQGIICGQICNYKIWIRYMLKYKSYDSKISI